MNLKKGKSSSARIYLLEQPTESDVLCGRGNVFASNPGNVAFQRIICENMDKYSAVKGGRPEKVKVVDDVMRQVKESGARIVKHEVETNRWYEISRAEAHQKVGHCLRDTIRSRSNAAGKPKKQQGATPAADYCNNNKPFSFYDKSRKNKNKSSDAIQKQIQQKRLALHKNMKSIDDFVSTIVCGGGTIDPYYKKFTTTFGSNPFNTTTTAINNNNKNLNLAIDSGIDDVRANPVRSINDIILREKNKPDERFSSLTKDASLISRGQQRRQSSMILFDDEFPESDMSFSPSTFFNSLRIH